MPLGGLVPARRREASPLSWVAQRVADEAGSSLTAAVAFRPSGSIASVA